jgi:hypothetical protein|tara:strand:- start:633 stop:974 length:342 start_codon:yes stop_codon:yes gene_type:complete
MIEEFKPFIDDSKFKKLLHEFHREGWTNKGKILHKKFRDYLESVEGITYEISYSNLIFLNLETHVWSTTKYDVPKSRRGHLKRYREHRVLIIVLNQPSSNKRTIGCFPINKIN